MIHDLYHVWCTLNAKQSLAYSSIDLHLEISKGSWCTAQYPNFQTKHECLWILDLGQYRYIITSSL